MTPNAPPNKHLDYLLTAYLFENLSAAGKKEVETHLAQCPACREELEALRSTMGLLATVLNDGGKTYVFEEQRKKRVLEAARHGQLGFVARRVGGWQWKWSAVAAIVMVGFVCLWSLVFVTSGNRSRMAYRTDDTETTHYSERATTAPASTTASIGAAEFEGRSKTALMSERDVHPTDPTSKEDITVPLDALKKIELGDHFETINHDRPELKNAQGTPDSQMFHSRKGDIEGTVGAGGGKAGGATLEDMIDSSGAKSPGRGGGFGDGIGKGKDAGAGRGTFGNDGNRDGGGRRMMVQKHGGKKEDANKESQGLATNEALPKPTPENKPASPAAQKGLGIEAKDELESVQGAATKLPRQGKIAEELKEQLAQPNSPVTEAPRKDIAIAAKDDTIRRQENTITLLDAEAESAARQAQVAQELNKQLAQQNTAIVDRTTQLLDQSVSAAKQDEKKVVAPLDNDFVFDDGGKRDPTKNPVVGAAKQPDPSVVTELVIQPPQEPAAKSEGKKDEIAPITVTASGNFATNNAATFAYTVDPSTIQLSAAASSIVTELPPPAGAIVTGKAFGYNERQQNQNSYSAPSNAPAAVAATPPPPPIPSPPRKRSLHGPQYLEGQAKEKEIDVASGNDTPDSKPQNNPVFTLSLESAPKQPEKPAIAATTPVGGATPTYTSPPLLGVFPNDGGPGLSQPYPAVVAQAQPADPVTMWAKPTWHANDNQEHEFFSGSENGKDDGARLNKLTKQGYVAKSLQSLGDIEKKGGIVNLAEDEDVGFKRLALPKMQTAVQIDEAKINALTLGITSRAGDIRADGVELGNLGTSGKDATLKYADVTKANNNRDFGDNERKEEGTNVEKLREKYREELRASMAGNSMAAKLADNDEASISSAPLIQYPSNWDQIAKRADKAPELNSNLFGKGVDVYQLAATVPDQPDINGKVLANRDDVGLVMLSVGSNNNVKLGHQFTISKGAEYKGIAQVVNVFPDMCSAKIVANTNGLKIEPNDEVQSRSNERAQIAVSPTSLNSAELSLRGYRALRDENPKLTLAQFFRRPDVVHPVPLTDEGLDEDDYVTKYGTRPFVDCARDHLSTFGLDVDTAAYTLARAALRSEKLPDPGSVKVEEFLNYFKQDYQVQGDEAFGVFAESAQSPFVDSPLQPRDATPLASALNESNLHSRELLKIGIKSRAARPGERKPAMLTFVVDTSGSMSKPAGVYKDVTRLGLVKQSLTALVEALHPDDAVSIVGFRDQAELVLPRTQASQKQRILDAIDSMSARGSTNVETGLNLGYRMADEAYATNAVNRMILFSDGVANVGEKGPDEILKLVKIFAARGIDLSTIGIGMGKINDPMMRTLADNGNGSCHFADTLAEAQTILTQKLPPHLNVLARDAKVQVDFDSDTVKSYRLLGYEKRKIADKDFRNDKIDSGDVTHDTLVTVFYEIVRQSGVHGALGKVYLRWKDAGSPRLEVVERNYPLEQGIYAGPANKATPDFRFLACVARFAELLRDSKWTRHGSYAEVLAELDRLPNEFKSKPECQEVRDLVSRAQRLSVAKWKTEIQK